MRFSHFTYWLYLTSSSFRSLAGRQVDHSKGNERKGRMIWVYWVALGVYFRTVFLNWQHWKFWVKCLLELFRQKSNLEICEPWERWHFLVNIIWFKFLLNKMIVFVSRVGKAHFRCPKSWFKFGINKFKCFKLECTNWENAQLC